MCVFAYVSAASVHMWLGVFGYPKLYSFLLTKEMVVEDSGEVARMEVENMKQLSEMEEELEETKRQKLLTGASEADITAALDEIKKQQEAKKRVSRPEHLQKLYLYFVYFKLLLWVDRSHLFLWKMMRSQHVESRLLSFIVGLLSVYSRFILFRQFTIP